MGKFSIEEQAEILLSERSNNKLNTDKLSYLFPEVSTIKEAVNKCFRDYLE